MMKDQAKTKEQLIKEVVELRQRLAGCEASEVERKQAEEALRESEEKYRHVVERANDGILIIQDGIIKYANPHAEEISGYTVTQSSEAQFINYLHPDEMPKVVDRYQRRMAGEDVESVYETIVRRKDGSDIYVEINAGTIAYRGKPADLVFIRDITERKQAEEALKESEELSRGMLEAATVGIYIVQDGKFQYVNPQFGHIGGYTADDFLGKDSLVRVHPDDREMVRKKAIEHLKGQSTLPYEYRFKCKDGGELWILEKVSSIQYKGKQAAIGSFMDITERKQAEEALRESEHNYRVLFDSVIDGIVVIDAETMKMVLANGTAAKMYGFDSPEEMVEANLLDYIHPDDRDWAISTIAKDMFEKDLHQVNEFRTFTKDGKEKWIEAVGVRIEYGGRMAGLCSFSDITERKQAEEALRESEERLRALIQNAPDAIYTNDLRGNFTSGNRKAEEMVGYARQELTGSNFFEKGILPQEYVPKAIELLESNRRGEPTGPDEFELVRKDGTRVWVEISTFPVNSGGEVEVMGIARDITERRRVEEEIIRHSKCVEVLNAISAAVSQTMDLDEMLNSALEKVLEVTETEAGYIHLYDWERKELALRVHRGISEKYAATLERLPVSEEVIRRWQNEPEPSFRARRIVSEPADSDAIAAELEDGIAVLATLPLASKSGMHGGLTLVGGTRRWFSPEELELLKAICNEIAVGIENARLLERTRELSVTDELTGLYNRRHFYEVLENEMARTQRYGGYFTLAMLDLDEFKEYNDRFGHTNGDAILRSVGRTLRSQLRNADMVFRYGGDEFTLVLPATDAAKARKIVDRIRAKRLQGLKEQNKALEPALGFSAGIAQFPEDAETADALVFLVDAALYRSKRGGGGKSTLVSEMGELAAGALDSTTMDQVYALAAMVDAKDPHTYGHSKRVATISEMIGKEIGLQPKELADLHAAALLHDIGKVGVPDSILTKPGKPTEHEWKIIRKHPVEGAKIIGYVKELEGLVPLVRHHHEWCNGTGYPDRLKGENIPIGARIISIADAYDTMTTPRPYRDVVSQEEALEDLRRCSGTQFDPELVEAFSRAVNMTIQQDTGKMKSPSLVPK